MTEIMQAHVRQHGWRRHDDLLLIRWTATSVASSWQLPTLGRAYNSTYHRERKLLYGSGCVSTGYALTDGQSSTETAIKVGHAP